MSKELTWESIQTHPEFSKQNEKGYEDIYDEWHFFIGPLEIYFDGPDDMTFGTDGDEFPSQLQPKTWHQLELLCRLMGEPIKDDACERMLAACKAWDEGFTEGEEFTPEQFRVWVNERRRLAREAIAKWEGGTPS